MLPVKSLTKAPIRNELLMEHHANPAAVACSPPQQQCVLVLVGPPGSGKSTLAALLQPDFHRISQDVLGSRGKCLAAAEAAMLRGCSVVIDRCNFDAEQRGTWVHLAQRMAVPAVAIILNAPVNVCLQRVGHRRGHEGGIEGTGAFATGVVMRMNADLKTVTEAECFAHVRVFPHDQPPHAVAADIFNRFGMPLQPNWVPLREEKSGKLYYGNALTRVTTWTRPAVAPTPRPTPSSSAAEVPSRKLWVGNLHPLADKRYVVMDNRLRPSASKGFGFVEFCEISSAVAAKAAMDSAVPPAPEQQQTPPPFAGHQRHAQLFEMGFHPQAVGRALELAGGDENAALMLLMDGAIDLTQQQQQQQQQQQIQCLSVRFAKDPASSSIPQSRPRGGSRGSSPPAPLPPVQTNPVTSPLSSEMGRQNGCADSDTARAADERACDVTAPVASASSAIAGTHCSFAKDAGSGHSTEVTVSEAAAASDHSPHDWVLLQHPDDSSVVAFGNIVTREFSLQPCGDVGGPGSGGS